MAKPPLRKPKKKVCPFCKDKITYVDYKDTALLRKFISDRGKIRARRVTGYCSQQQRRSPRRSRTPARWRCCPTRPPRAEGGPTMKLILTQEVTGLGAPGDVVEVKDGYGRNYLCRAARDPLDQGRREAGRVDQAGPRASARSATSSHAQEVKAQLEALKVTLAAAPATSAGCSARSPPADVADGGQGRGRPGPRQAQDRDRRSRSRPLGAHQVTVRLHPEGAGHRRRGGRPPPDSPPRRGRSSHGSSAGWSTPSCCPGARSAGGAGDQPGVAAGAPASSASRDEHEPQQRPPQRDQLAACRPEHRHEQRHRQVRRAASPAASPASQRRRRRR